MENKSFPYLITQLGFALAMFFVHKTVSFPSGAPLSACGNLMPVHVDGEQQNSASPYVLILNDTTYGNYPLKLTVSVAGAGARDFMAFMLQARSEYGESVGYFSGLPPASKTMTCYGNDDTLTHTAAYIRPGMEVLWNPPGKNIGTISITGSVALNKVKYWAVQSSDLKGTGVLDRSGAKAPVQQSNDNSNSSSSSWSTDSPGNTADNTVRNGDKSLRCGDILPWIFMLPVIARLVQIM